MLDEDHKYRYRNTGYSRNTVWGYKVDYSNGNGFLNTQEEVDCAKDAYKMGGLVRLGDVKYLDLNDDGFIDSKDHAPLGYPEIPRVTYGFSGLLNYKNIDFSFLFSGIAQASRGRIGGPMEETGNNGFYTGWHHKAWTQERYDNGEEILYPALTASSSSSKQTSDFFLLNRAFLRLKNIELGYSFSQKWLKQANISRVRVYVNSNNLLTWHHYPVTTVDPETTGATSYPVMRTASAGLNIVF
jgi:hypothetical protein